MAKILMIDDDPDYAAGIQILLEARRHQFFLAPNGEEGLKQVKALDPDLIILDVMMDTRTEGFHVSLQLRDRAANSEFAEYRDVPILMLTSIHQSTAIRYAPDTDFLPVDSLLEKSARLDVILAQVESLLAGRNKGRNLSQM
jgi:DNA-binding response OmpR family regulator